MFKKIIIGICTVIVVYGVVWIQLSKNYELNKVSIVIKEEFQQEYNNYQFTADDFEWANIENISYGLLNATDLEGNPIPNTSRYMEITLNMSGPIQVLFAIWHFKTLEFVEKAKFTGNQSVTE
jgi:hypothetical protein